MEPEDIKKYGLGCGVLMLGFLCFIYVMPFINQSRHIATPKSPVQEQKIPETAPAPAPVQPKKTPSQILEELSYGKDPSKTYETAMKYYREGSEEEKLAAIKVLPSLNMKIFEEASGRNSLEDARKAYMLNLEILEKCTSLDEKKLPYGLKDSIRYMKGRIAELQIYNFKEILASGDRARTDAEIDRAWKDPEGVLPERETVEYLASTWKISAEKDASSKDSEAALERAADFAVQNIHDISYWKYRNGPLEQALVKQYQFKELVGLGKKSLQEHRPVTALAYFSAAIKALSSSDSKVVLRYGSDEWLELQRLFCESMIGVAALAEEGKLRWLPPDSDTNRVEILLQLAARNSTDAAKADKTSKPPETKYAVSIKAWDELFKLYRGKLRRISGTKENHSIMSFCNTTLTQTSSTYISYQIDWFGPDRILASLPEKLKGEIEKKSKSPNERIAEVLNMIRLKRYVPDFPGREEFLAADLKAKYETGSELFANGKFPEAFTYFREILREYPAGQESAGIIGKLDSRIEEARKGKDFNAVYHLASFLIGEMGKTSLPDSTKSKMEACLLEAADFFKDSSPIKRAFMLSLLSDLLSGTDKGNSARDEAMKIGFDAVKKLPLKEQERPALKLPSTLDGCSIEAIRNSTPYHLMAFYDGPEKFLVRLNPYSRGSFAYLDGEYDIAVVVASDSVVPYRSKAKYAKEYSLVKYFISVPGRENNMEYSDMFMGEFSVLRIPKDFKGASVEPESGIIYQKSDETRTKAR